MYLSYTKIAPGAAFWQTTARTLLDAAPALLASSDERATTGPGLQTLERSTVAARCAADLSGLRIVVPSFGHGQQLREALAGDIAVPFIAPRICTMSAWLAMQPPHLHTKAGRVTGSQRLMSLYAELRQHAWLKKLFSARGSPDLLPLAQTLLALADELTAAFLPVLETHPGSADERWGAALAQLPPTARSILSDESQLVWSIWKSQLDADDPSVARFARMRTLATMANMPLVWIAAERPDPCSRAFLDAWAERQPVLLLVLDWRLAALPATLAQAWPEIVTGDDDAGAINAKLLGPDGERLGGRWRAGDPAHGAAGKAAQWSASGLVLSPGSSLEDEAQNGAQTVVDWLEQGKTSVAIVVQDRVVARRIRALLQRAQVQVADETGWKLSTTRAAAALTAWFEVVTSRAETIVLLDFLKSPFMLDDADADQVMEIELAVRRANVAGGWRAILAAVSSGPGHDSGVEFDGGVACCAL